MKLKDCTKAELIRILESSMCFADTIERELIDIEWERKQKKIEIADKANKESSEHLNAYFDFLKKYDGFKIGDIPLAEAEAAKAHLDKSKELFEKYNKIYDEVYGS